MFTGLVEATARVVSCNHHNDGMVVGIDSPEIISSMRIGDSLAINGVCLTLTKIDNTTAYVNIVPETLRVTTLSTLQIHQKVNLERALSVGDRFAGHFVLGHVDTTAHIIDVVDDGVARTLTFSLAEKYAPYAVPKGQIAIDGISLTIVAVYPHSISSCDATPAQPSSGVYREVHEQRGKQATKSQLERRRGDDVFTVTFIPHTQLVTIAGEYQVGDTVNLEFDILAKYIHKQCALQQQEACHG